MMYCLGLEKREKITEEMRLEVCVTFPRGFPKSSVTWLPLSSANGTGLLT